MHTQRIRHRLMGGLMTLIVLSLVAIPAAAHHAWGNYHWARTANPFTLKAGDNVDPSWDTYLDQAITDWNKSTVLDLAKVPGANTTAQSLKKCNPTLGRIEVCNASYGGGWLGLAQIWTDGDHITQATAKMNEKYFTTATYNTPAWRRLVMCQEVAHDFGLDHQNEGYGAPNLGSCMDYTNDPDGGGAYGPSNEHPNQADFDQLLAIYDPAFAGTNHTGTGDADLDGHIDTTTTIRSSTSSTAAEAEVGEDPSTWGEVIERDGKGRPSHYRKDVGNGKKIFTFVIYPDAEQGQTVDPGTGNDGTANDGTTDDGKNDKKDSKHKSQRERRHR